MARLSAHGPAVVRWLDFDRHAVFSLHRDGVTLRRDFLNPKWRVYSRWNPDNPNGTTCEAYVEKKASAIRRRSGRIETGLTCACSTVHDLRSWGRAGRPSPCPCPSPEQTSHVRVYVYDGHLPSFSRLQNWTLFDGIAETPDGCSVEPDAFCEHGFYAWPRALGII